MDWTMIMSSRGWHALHGLAGLPATPGTGIPRAGDVRTRQFRLQARRSRRTGRSPACPRFCSVFCFPDGPFRRYSLWPGSAAQGWAALLPGRVRGRAGVSLWDHGPGRSRIVCSDQGLARMGGTR